VNFLIISPTQSGIGGIAGVVQNQRNFLKKQGYSVDIISSENTFTIPIRGLKNPSFMISSYLKTKLNKNYDIVHAHNPISAMAMKNIHGKKILSLWGLFSEQIEILHGKTLSKISNQLEKNSLKWADVITVASKEIQNHYRNLGYETHYIPNAINIEDLSTESKRNYKKQIIYVGRLSKEKGSSTLIEISKNLNDEIDLIIIGSGPDKEFFKTLSLKRKNIHFLGYQPKNVVIPLIRGSDILLSPSLKEGGVSTTILEGMACKTAIIATKLAVYDEELDDDAILKISSNDSEKFINSINYLIDDSSKREKLSEKGYELSKLYSWDNIGKKYLDIYQKLQNS
jgi:glycosyltransferase involved in cell wall biosynthesis